MIFLEKSSDTVQVRTHRRWPNYRSPYRPDVEGLRAIAVLTVVAFHAAIPFVGGGFVGVDVFFVISGFLITSLMLTEAADTGRVSLRQFYARRARRILPAAATVLVATGVASFVILPLLRVRDLSQDLVLSALYASNWRFIAVGTDYLAQNRAPSPFLHYWSLAVEEQFYLVWPVLLALVIAVARIKRVKPVPAVAFAMLVVTLASFALSMHLTQTSPALAYMASPTRAWQFGCGALLAVLGPWLMRAGSIVRALVTPIGWAGVAAIAYATVVFSGTTSYPGIAAVVPTLGATAVILSGTVWQRGSGPTVGALLSTRAMRGIGRLSYAWYLWHWPALVLVEAQFGEVPWPVKALVVIASAGPAWLTLRLVERPIRFSKVVAARASSGLSIGAIGTVLALMAGLGVGSTATRELEAPAMSPASLSLDAVFGPDTSSLNSGNVLPNALAARTDLPQGKCLTDQNADTLSECSFGKNGGPVVVLFGDSHAHQWQPAFQTIATERGWSLHVLAHAGCPVAPLPPGAHTAEAQCNAWRDKAVARIRELRPSLIIVSSFSHYLRKKGDRLPAWNQEFAVLRSTGAHIAYIVDTPVPNTDVPVCISGHATNWSACAFDRRDAVWPDPVERGMLLGEETGVSVIDLTAYLCPDTMCPSVRGRVLFYRDSSHITATLAKVMTPAMAAELDKAGLTNDSLKTGRK